MSLADIPFLGAYEEQKRRNRQVEDDDLRRASGAMGLMAALEKHKQDAAMRAALAESGGDVEKAMQIVVRGGNLSGARDLASVLEAQRKSRTPVAPPFRTITRGTDQVNQELGPDSQWRDVGTGPRFSPGAPPEILNLQGMLEKLPEGHPFRAQIEARINHLSRGGTQGGTFGAGTTGRSLDILTQHAPAYAAGALTPEQERQFEAALTHYTQPRQYQNPDTGLLETRKPALPPFVTEAVRRRRSGAPAAGPLPAPAPGPGPAPSPRPQPQPAPQAAPGAPRGQPEQTVWGLTSLTAGPVPWAAETLSRTPIVGEVVRAPQFTQARNFTPQLQRDLVRTLMNNPRYAEGERKAIEQEININPAIFDTPGAARDRLIGIDNALAIRQRNAFETSQSSSVGREERIQAMNVLNALTKFRQSLGVPSRIRGDQDFNALPSGAEFVDPEGQVRRKP